MNIILLSHQEKISKNKYKLDGEKFLHLKKTLKVVIGQKILVGKINGFMGYGEIKEIKDDSIIINTIFNTEPPKPLPIKLVIALPRPKMLKRIFRSISMLGVKEIYLINTFKVEKSFWNSQILKNQNFEKYFLQGLEQSKDTIMPKLIIRNRFKPFVEDELPSIIHNTLALVAHPGDYPLYPQGVKQAITLVIGPEGGFTDYEISKLEEVGLKTVRCGSRILRMETAVVSLISQHASFLD